MNYLKYGLTILFVPFQLAGMESVARIGDFLEAVSTNQEVVVEMPRVPGIDVNTQDNEESALMVAAKDVHVKALRQWLEGIDVNTQDNEESALMMAAEDVHVNDLSQWLEGPRD